MVPREFNLTEFVESVKDQDYLEIIKVTEGECLSAERQGFRGNERAAGYARDLKGLLFAMRYAVKPLGVERFHLFKPIWESLIVRGQFKPESILIFGQQSRGTAG